MKLEQISVGNYTYMYFSYKYFLESMKRLGVQTVELWGATPHFHIGDDNYTNAKHLRKTLNEYGMNVSCVTPEQVMYPINIGASSKEERMRSIEFFRRYIDVANLLECPRMLVTSGRHNIDQSAEDCFKYSVDSLIDLGHYAQMRGVRIAHETLTREGYDLSVRAEDIRRTLEAVSNPFVRGMIDVDESARFGESPKDFVRALGVENIEHVHFVDGMPGGHLAMGDGVLPMRRYLEELDAAGYQGYISLEVMNERYYRDPEPAIEQSVEFLRRYVRERQDP
ncbi:MAG TPA: sugar phosphate isomerase/epimerase [Candidatus Pullichristensenella excrementigallinarum]|uniref:Sugar phosphate isomerase/epimerase n=1 Tax=Candidatus Pullichristensenella excrementigallinarum TaxID=2840907 RepID=A0A9D1IA70_9FIRM|nr:sugar phosphate isomerase/epimerase [Candidatus Pullichristensenella excrementigallinarum]